MDADGPMTLLRDRSVRTLLFATFASTVAAIAQSVALGKYVFDLTGRPIDLGLLGLAEFLPAMLLVVLTGHAADRFDRRRIVAIGLAGEAATALGLGWYVTISGSSLGPILVLVVLFGVARAFVAPAVRSLPLDVVAPERLPRLVPLFSLAFQSGLIVGPVIGGLLYAVGPGWPFAVDAVIVGVATVAILRVRVDHAARGVTEAPTMRTAFEGLRVIRLNPILLGAISLDLFAVLFGGAIALLPAIAEDRLGVGVVGLGWLRAAGGIGAALTAVTLAARPVRRHVGVVLFVAVAMFGLFTVLLGITTSYAVAFAAILVLSGADSVSVFIRATLVPLVTPDAARGRVLAVENVFIGASNELGAFESGVAGQLLGASGAVVFGGLATLVIAVVWTLLFPALRGVDRFTDLRKPDR